MAPQPVPGKERLNGQAQQQPQQQQRVSGVQDLGQNATSSADQMRQQMQGYDGLPVVGLCRLNR
jgi:hypothetical protein